MSGKRQQLEADFDLFSDVGGGSSGSQALQELERVMAEAGIDEGDDEDFGPAQAGGTTAPQFWQDTLQTMGTGSAGHDQAMSMFAGAEDYELLFLGSVVKGKVKKLIKKLHSYVRKYDNLAGCVPAVTQTVVLFKAGSYVKALAKGYEAFSCIKSKL